MNPLDPRHGTTRGFHAGCRDQCCRAAISRYQKTIRWNQLTGQRLSVPALGAQRRIQALMAMGWTGNNIAKVAGFKHPNYVRRVLVGQKGKPCTWLERKTHDAIVEAFEKLAMKLPPSLPHHARTRTMARRRGFLPPLAWDDIDNPAERPRRTSDLRMGDDVDEIAVERVLAGDPSGHTTTAEKREVVRRWTGTRNELERLTGWNVTRYTTREDGAA